MAIRYISKGKGKNRKTFPIRPKKKGVTVRSVSLRPSAVVKVNKEQIKLLNRGEPATFSKALNQVIIRAKRDGIPTYDTHVNTNNRRKPYHMFVTDMKKHKKVKGSDTIVMADSYGQAVDDFITVWNKDPDRMKNTIGYPVVHGTADRSFRYARDGNLKLVKGAHLQNDDGMYRLIHYGTQIFSYDPETKKAIVAKDLSRTSNKQIKMALEFFDPKTTENIEPDEKWKFGGH